MSAASSGQLGFDALLRSADADNHARTFARETAHLPATMDGALPFFRDQLRDHHAPMLAGNVDETMRLRGQADKLASRLNGGDPGILAGPDAPGCVLERESAAAPGAVPLWGQTESFIVDLRGMRVRVEMEGVFGTGSGVCFWPGFAARAVDLGRPFLSPTGYRSFLGIHADPQPGLTPGGFALRVIEAHVARELKGRLVPIEARYRTGAGQSAPLGSGPHGAASVPRPQERLLLSAGRL
jgi:hypothetical protein